MQTLQETVNMAKNQPADTTKEDETFMDQLIKNIVKRDKNVMKQLNSRDPKDMRKLLMQAAEEENKVDTQDKGKEIHTKDEGKKLDCMQLAAFFHGDVTLINKLAELAPDLIWRRWGGQYTGQTVLHIVIMQQNVEAATVVLDVAERSQNKMRGWLHTEATGSMFDGTVMMGGLPLSVAALTFNLDMVELLIDRGAEISRGNKDGDTVFHTLVRFAALYTETRDDVIKTTLGLHELLLRKPNKLNAEQSEETPTSKKGTEARDVWLIENKEGLTALRLAAAYTETELFKLILNLEGVYRKLDDDDGLYDSLLYDVTEIDSVAFRLYLKKKGASTEANQISDNRRRESMINTTELVNFKPQSSRDMSVMEILGETAHVINIGVVREMIKRKWIKYRPLFWIWAVLHVLFMIVITIHTVYKAELISDDLQGQPSSDAERNFVTAVAGISLGVPALVVPMELMLLIIRKQPYKLELHHHNGLYRVLILVFAISLAVDSIWYLVMGPDNNYFLILALLVGWWFTTFFLRPFQKFSFYTVMLQRIVFGDMLRFSAILLLMWVSFSVSMHTAYLATSDPSPPPEFKDVGTSMLTMFQLMFGLAEMNLLYGSRNQWLVITLFILFTLLTYVLMLNALIAMMANTCSSVAENKVRQYELQRLSVVLMLESMMPCDKLTYNCGEGKVVRRRHPNGNTCDERRFFLKVPLPLPSNNSRQIKALMDAHATEKIHEENDGSTGQSQTLTGEGSGKDDHNSTSSTVPLGAGGEQTTPPASPSPPQRGEDDNRQSVTETSGVIKTTGVHSTAGASESAGVPLSTSVTEITSDLKTTHDPETVSVREITSLCEIPPRSANTAVVHVSTQTDEEAHTLSGRNKKHLQTPLTQTDIIDVAPNPSNRKTTNTDANTPKSRTRVPPLHTHIHTHIHSPFYL